MNVEADPEPSEHVDRGWFPAVDRCPECDLKPPQHERWCSAYEAEPTAGDIDDR